MPGPSTLWRLNGVGIGRRRAVVRRRGGADTAEGDQGQQHRDTETLHLLTSALHSLGRRGRPPRCNEGRPQPADSGRHLNDVNLINELAARLPSRDESVAPGTILDGEGRVIRVVPAAEFRRPQLPSRGTWRDRRRDKPPRQGRGMRDIVAAVVLGPLLVSAPARGEEMPPPDRPTITPAPLHATMTEAERRLEESMGKRRREDLLRAMKPSPPPNPDLGYDLTTAIQQRIIEKSLPR